MKLIAGYASFLTDVHSTTDPHLFLYKGTPPDFNITPNIDSNRFDLTAFLADNADNLLMECSRNTTAYMSPYLQKGNPFPFEMINEDFKQTLKGTGEATWFLYACMSFVGSKFAYQYIFGLIGPDLDIIENDFKQGTIIYPYPINIKGTYNES